MIFGDYMTEEVTKNNDDETNPLIVKMNRVIQGQTFRLPSRGHFYKNGELDNEVVDGEIRIYPVTTIEEIMLRSYDLLYQGTAISNVFSRCVPQIKKPMDLLAKDVDYILTALRKVSYGNIIPINYKCEFCETPKEHTYEVSINNFLKNLKEIDTEDMKKFELTLATNQVVKLRPSKFIEILKISNYNEETESFEEAEKILVETLASIIVEVDDIKDQELIRGWLKKLPAAVSKQIQQKVFDVNNWGPEFMFKINCKDCKKEKDLSTIVNPVYFFTLPSSQEIKTN